MEPKGLLRGKAAIITGGEGSIGLATARAFVAEATGASTAQAAALFEQLIPLARHAAPEEVARAMLFLASEEASFITGMTLPVDGGRTIL